MGTEARLVTGVFVGIVLTIIGMSVGVASSHPFLANILLPGASLDVVLAGHVHATTATTVFITTLVATPLIYMFVVERVLWLVGRLRSR